MADMKPDEKEARAPTADTQSVSSSPVAINQTLRKSKRADKKLVVLILAVLFTAAIALLFIYGRGNDQFGTGPVNDPHASLKGSSANTGITFTKPDSLNLVSGENTDNLKGFVQLEKSQKSDALVSVSRILARSNPTNYANAGYPSEEDVKAIKSLLADPANPDYSENIQRLNDFAKSAFPEPTVSVLLGTATDFNNTTIKTNAWQFDVTVTDSTSSTPDQYGKLIWALGENSSYLFLYTDKVADWQSGTAAWQATLDSIKIDQ